MRTGKDLILNGEIILSGDVLLDAYVGWMWEEDVFFSPKMVREALSELGEGEVTVRLNSMGGHSDAGESIRAILAGHPGGCRIIVEGIAASSASLLFMAGKKRIMTGGSHLMIHDPSGVTFGNEDETRRGADNLAIIANTYAAVYAAASGKSAEAARAIMKAETWYGPESSVTEGFADEVIPLTEAVQPPPPDMAAARAVFMSAHQRLSHRLSMKQPDEAARPGRQPAAPRGDVTLENQMNVKTNPTPADQTTAPVIAPATMSIQDAIAAERTRTRMIREMAAPFMLSGRLTQTEVDTVTRDLYCFSDSMFGFVSGALASAMADRAITIHSDGGATSYAVFANLEREIRAGESQSGRVHIAWHGQNNAGLYHQINEVNDRLAALLAGRRYLLMSVLGQYACTFAGGRIVVVPQEYQRPGYQPAYALRRVIDHLLRQHPDALFDTRAEMAAAAGTTPALLHPGMTEAQVAAEYGIAPFSFFFNLATVPWSASDLVFKGYRSAAGLPTGGAANDYFIRSAADGANAIGQLMINEGGTWVARQIGDITHITAPAGQAALAQRLAVKLASKGW